MRCLVFLLLAFSGPSFAWAPARRFFAELNPLSQWQTYAIVGGASLSLSLLDQWAVDHSQKFSSKLGIMHEGESGKETGDLFKIHAFGHSSGLRYPTSTNAFFWFIGDGSTSLAVIAGFAGYGYLGASAYALETASQIAQGLLLTGTLVIGLKLLSGRESPERATVDGGKWQGYPGLKAYIADQPRYYSYPSGHTATAVTVFGVLIQRYPEQRWLKPAAFVGTGALMLSLVNNRDHWPSDFPLAIAIGLAASRAVVAGGSSETAATQNQGLGWEGVHALPHPEGGVLVSTAWHW